MSAANAKSTNVQDMVQLELNPAGGVDVLGDASPPLLRSGEVREFTSTEAAGLLALVNEHGTKIVRIAQGAKS